MLCVHMCVRVLCVHMYVRERWCACIVCTYNWYYVNNIVSYSYMFIYKIQTVYHGIAENGMHVLTI